MPGALGRLRTCDKFTGERAELEGFSGVWDERSSCRMLSPPGLPVWGRGRPGGESMLGEKRVKRGRMKEDAGSV